MPVAFRTVLDNDWWRIEIDAVTDAATHALVVGLQPAEGYGASTGFFWKPGSRVVWIGRRDIDFDGDGFAEDAETLPLEAPHLEYALKAIWNDYLLPRLRALEEHD